MTEASLIGELLLRPGDAAQPVRLHRPDVAARLLDGCEIQATPGRVAALFTLCAHAQAFTCRQVLAAATGSGREASAEERRALRLNTAREQLIRIVHDWPRVSAQTAGDDPHASGPADAARRAADSRALTGLLSSCPLWGAGLADDQRLGGLAAWLEGQLLGLPVGTWLQAQARSPETWAVQWSAQADTATARWLHRIGPTARALHTPSQPLGVLVDPGRDMPMLAGLLLGEHGFVGRPTWHGTPCDTGPWARASDAGPQPGIGRPGPQPAVVDAVLPAGAAGRGPRPEATVWHRLVSRLVDLLRLAIDATHARLVHGAIATGTRQAVAWVETARGLLVHAVALGAGPGPARVARYRVLAPTDWNFHPQGGLARAVAALQAGDEAAARLLAMAYDPCVPVRVQPVAAECAHA